MRFWSRAALVVLATLLVGAAALALASVLATGAPATCVETGCFCEAVGTSIPLQFEASLSSLVFVALGAWALLHRAQPLTPERRLVPLGGIAMILIGASSFVYHATLSFVGQWLDVFTMYLFGLVLALGALWRSGRLGPRASIGLYVGLAIVLGVAQYVYPDARRILFAAVLLPGIVLELMPRTTGHALTSPRMRWVIAGVATMVVAFSIWLVDQSPLCDPTFWLQGHAVWHALGAVAAFLVTMHWRRTAHPPPTPLSEPVGEAPG